MSSPYTPALMAGRFCWTKPVLLSALNRSLLIVVVRVGSAVTTTAPAIGPADRPQAADDDHRDKANRQVEGEVVAGHVLHEVRGDDAAHPDDERAEHERVELGAPDIHSDDRRRRLVRPDRIPGPARPPREHWPHHHRDDDQHDEQEDIPLLLAAIVTGPIVAVVI